MRNVKELVINTPNFLITDNEENHIAINVSSILKSLIIESTIFIANQPPRAIAIISGEKDGNFIYGPRYRVAGGALYLIHALITIEDKL